MIRTSFDDENASNALVRGDIGIVYQDDVLWPELTVEQNL